MPYDIYIGRNKSDKEIFGNKGLVYTGKGYVTMGNYTSLSNLIWLDVARSHVIMVAGKRGSGKCLHGDTLISLSDGSQIPIKYLEENKNKILALDNKFKIKTSEKSEFFSREVNKLLKIKLRSGKEIKLTPEHPLLTIKGWKPIQELNIGSRIATPRKSCFGNQEMSEHKIKLLAYLTAEGHTMKGYVLFSNSDNVINKDFVSSVEKFDNNLKVEVHGGASCYRVSNKNNRYNFKENKLKTWLQSIDCYGDYAKEKKLPQHIFRLNKNNLSLFLNRLFSCDGSLYKINNYWEGSYSSSSPNLIKQIQSLLLKFGILSKLRDKKIKYNNKIVKSYELVINSENLIKFIEDIGFFGKKHELEFRAKQEILSRIRNTNIDTIPKEIWDTYKPKNWAAIGRALGYKHPKAMRERIRYSPSRQTLLNIAEVEQNNPLYLLATSDILWDEIVSMEILEGSFTVYDICVPNEHNFTANDIIVHNSYTLGVIAEELCDLPKEISQNIAPIIFDTMGIFWTMKFKNEKEAELLQQWDLKPKNVPVVVWAPHGQYKEYEKRQIPIDKKFALEASELTAEDWVLTFKLGMIDPISILIQQAIDDIGENTYTVDNIIKQIDSYDIALQTKQAARSLFQAAKTWGIFAEKNQKGTKISELVAPGKSTIIDVSTYSSIGAFNVRALVIGLICKKIFNQRMFARKKEEIFALEHGADYLNVSEKREMPLVWIFIDEAHEFLPMKGKTAATDALIQILREGRQPGLSLVMATQQPGVIHRDAMTQSDIVIAHRVTAKPDIEALNSIMQTYLLESIRTSMDALPSLKGSALILDDNSERIYPMRVRPKFTWHGGEAPTAIKVEKRL